ncbi:MAG: hypothetical protein WCK14_03435 [Actinomycetota bacterium]|jgi:hypothetical protein
MSDVATEPSSTTNSGAPSGKFTTQSTKARAAIGVALAVLVAGGVIFYVATSGTTRRHLQGTLTITVKSAAGDPCATAENFPEFRDGGVITVLDKGGSKVASGRLGTGRAEGTSCVHSLEISDPPVLGEYQVVIGSRDPFVVTAESLAAAGGKLDLRFGA